MSEQEARDEEFDDFTWDDLCTDECPEGCEADHKGEQ